jgi:hypothetical protein
MSERGEEEMGGRCHCRAEDRPLGDDDGKIGEDLPAMESRLSVEWREGSIPWLTKGQFKEEGERSRC